MPRIFTIVAPAAWLISFMLMQRRVEPFYTHFYPIAWWCYIVFVAAWNEMGPASRLFRFPSLFQRPLSYAGLVLYSSVVWFFFELYNTRLHNWAYIGVPVQWWIRWPGYFISFGTVLPGIFETARWLEARWAATTKTPVATAGTAGWRRGAGRLAVAGGAACMVLPILYPDWFFPLIWFGLVFLLDPLMQNAGDGSFVVNLCAGDRRRPLLLMCSGLICGLFWEFWNYWAGAKWVYALPYFHFWRIFEMPALGYLGFLPFGLECWLFFTAASELWGHSKAGLRVALVLLAAVICAAGVLAIDRYTVRSYNVPFFDDSKVATQPPAATSSITSL